MARLTQQQRIALGAWIGQLTNSLRAQVSHLGGTVCATDTSVKVRIPNPVSSFTLDVDGEVMFGDTEWKVKASSGSWDATQAVDLDSFAQRLTAMAACVRILKTIDVALLA